MTPSLPDAAPRAEIVRHQSERLAALLHTILPANRFYAKKLAGVSGDDWDAIPFTTKAELLADQERHPPYGTNLTYPVERYSRLHQTSGTSGRPLRWLDTPESWYALLDCWTINYRVVGVRQRRPAVLPVLVRPVPRLLDGVRGGVAARLPVPARRRHDQPGPTALPSRQRGHRRPLHADLRPAPRGSRARGRHRPGGVAGAGADRGRRTGRQHARNQASASKPAGAPAVRPQRHDGSRAARDRMSGGSRRSTSVRK